MDEAIYDALADRLATGQPSALATIIATRGSTPQGPGAKALFTAEGGVIGTIGGGCLENEARLRALDVLRDRQPVLIEVDLTHDYDQDSGLICGGKAEILIEVPGPDQAAFYAYAKALHGAARAAACAARVGGGGALAGRAIVAEEGDSQGDPALVAIARAALAARRQGVVEVEGQRVWVDLILPLPRLWIAGAGHVGRAVAQYAAGCDFEVHVVDDRPDLCSVANIPWASGHHVGEIEQVLGRPYSAEDYVVIVTRGHQHDADALRAVVGSEARYVGLIGSRRKIKLISEGLLEAGAATPDQLARLFAPIGLHIGAQTVDEIAICIVAELIAVRRGMIVTPADREAPLGSKR